jgi:DNA polymerase-3 subunit gamma/tau
MEQANYTVSARKYRPQDWDAVVGQAGITRTLQQAIASSQIAQAYLFCGPRGVGKTTSARIFARAINQFDAGHDEDQAFNVFELDAASNNKVEDIRSIVDQVRIPPQHGKYKVYIIDEVHMLSQAAFNAFLKTLEEPPAHAVFILATTEKHKILPTILSRCQIFDFHRITVDDMVKHLQGIAEKEGVTAEEAALHVVAQKADGALRDALSIFDQLVAFAGRDLTYDVVAEHLHVLDHNTYFTIVDHALAGEVAPALLVLDEIVRRGFDPHHFISGLGAHLRNVLVAKDAATTSLIEGPDDLKRRYAEQAAKCSLVFLIRGLDHVNQADVQYRGSQHQRLLVELTLMQLCSLSEADKKKITSLVPVLADAWRSRRSPESAPLRADAAPLVQSVAPASVAPAPTPPAPVGEAPPMRVGGLRKRAVKVVVPESLIAGTDREAKPEELPPIPDDWRDPVTMESVHAAYHAFAQQLQDGQRANLAATLRSAKLELHGEVVQLEVINEVQLGQLADVRPDLLDALRRNLRNAGLELRVNVAERDEPTMKYMTDRDRYDAMAAAQPGLDVLRRRLDLDLR